PLFLLYTPPRPSPHLHSFPTRRSSDLIPTTSPLARWLPASSDSTSPASMSSLPTSRCHSARTTPSSSRSTPAPASGCTPIPPKGDRKSTRLNSSHLGISYAVFCLKKKK